MVIDVDPEGTLGPDPGVRKRIPERGRLAVDVRTVPVFELTMIPFLWTPSPDSSIEETIRSMAADPGGHPLLSETRDLLPINELDVKAHATVWSSTNNGFSLLGQTEMIRVMEGVGDHVMGMMAGAVSGGVNGVATFAGRSTFSSVRPMTMAHELGHNLNLRHALCGKPTFLEPSFPGNDGSIGAWGYDFREPGRLLPPAWPDLMSYCRLSNRWMGEFHGGAVRLDEETDRPVTILQDPRTGEFRGILRGLAGKSGSGDDAVSALAVEPGLEVLTSRGIPGAKDWSR